MYLAKCSGVSESDFLSHVLNVHCVVQTKNKNEKTSHGGEEFELGINEAERNWENIPEHDWVMSQYTKIVRSKSAVFLLPGKCHISDPFKTLVYKP